MPRLGLIVVWLVAAVVATTFTWAALSSADRQVGGSPAVLAVPQTTATTGAATTSTRAARQAPSTSPSPAGTSPITAPPPSTSSTTSTSTTTTEPSTAEWTSLTVPSAGGVVVVRHRPEEVRLESATPSPGFTMEIDDSGPDEVRVEFEGVDADYEIRVRWANGVLEIDVRD